MHQQTTQLSPNYAGTAVQPTGAPWFVVQTRARHERKVAERFAEHSVESFAPTCRELHAWSDRHKLVDVPLFPCYVFLRASAWREVHRTVVSTPGVLGWVGTRGEPSPIPESQVEAVRSLLAQGLAASPYPFLRIGQRVRITGGCLDGVEGILVGNSGGRRLVVSIDLIQQSMAVTLDGYQLSPA